MSEKTKNLVPWRVWGRGSGAVSGLSKDEAPHAVTQAQAQARSDGQHSRTPSSPGGCSAPAAAQQLTTGFPGPSASTVARYAGVVSFSGFVFSFLPGDGQALGELCW